VRHHEAVGGFFDASQERADSTSFEGYEANVGYESEHAYEQLGRACLLRSTSAANPPRGCVRQHSEWIATLVVMQSTLGATQTLSIERTSATAVGASAGALVANYFRANLVAYAVAILLVGMLSFSFHLKKNAYRRKILLVLSP